MPKTKFTEESLERVCAESGTRLVSIDNLDNKGLSSKSNITFTCAFHGCEENVTKNLKVINKFSNFGCPLHARALGVQRMKRTKTEVVADDEEEKVEEVRVLEASDFITDFIQQGFLELTLPQFFDRTGFDAQKYFTSNFWFALNALKFDEWFVVPDEVIDAVGYKQCSGYNNNTRTNFFRAVRNYFVDEKDYKINLFKRIDLDNSNYKTNKNVLYMKRDSFKMLLLKADTPKTDDIYRYLIAFENHVHAYVQYQHRCQLWKYENSATKSITAYETVSRARTITNPFNCMVSKVSDCLYVVFLKDHELYKFGYSNCLLARLKNHLSTYESDIEITRLYPHLKANVLENHLKMELLARGIKTTYEFDGKGKTEVFDPKHLNAVLEILDFLVENTNFNFTGEQEHEYRMAKEKTEQLRIQLEITRLHVPIGNVDGVTV